MADFIQIIELISKHTPGGHRIVLTIENGHAGWHAIDAGGLEIENLDGADKDLIEQANDMLCVAHGWLSANKNVL